MWVSASPVDGRRVERVVPIRGADDEDVGPGSVRQPGEEFGDDRGVFGVGPTVVPCAKEGVDFDDEDHRTAVGDQR